MSPLCKHGINKERHDCGLCLVDQDRKAALRKDQIFKALVDFYAKLAGVICRDHLNKKYPRGFEVRLKK